MNAIAAIAEPLALGFSTGTWCVMYCAPVLLPFLFGRERVSHTRNLSLVGLFLGGRLFAYVGLGLALGAAGLLVTEFFDPALSRKLGYIAYIVCGAVLLLAGFAPRLLSSGSCRKACSRALPLVAGDRATAFLAGLSVGLHICPPFWTAAARSASAASPGAGAAYFLLFYVGTLPFFLPLLGVPFLSSKSAQFRRIARMTQILVGAYFLVCVGLIPFVFQR